MYGFADAPLIFSWVVRTRMYDAGFISHSLDVMAFLFYEKGCLLCHVIVHVDDFLFTASPIFDLDILTYFTFLMGITDIPSHTADVSEPSN